MFVCFFLFLFSFFFNKIIFIFCFVGSSVCFLFCFFNDIYFFFLISFFLFCVFCWFFSVGFFSVVVLLLLFCFVFLLIVLPAVAKQNERIQIFCLNLHFENTATPLTSLFPSTQLFSLVYLQASLLTSNPALALPRQGEIKVNTFGIFFLTDLKIKNMRMCNCGEYRDPFDNLSTEVIDKNETD